jgi:UDP:flavonoid glycosyltransferase YjiC (YdhE family)
MRFTVVTYGSEGDTRPLVALARGLLDAGHELRLFAEQSTIGSAQSLGVPVEALAGDLKSMLPLENPLRELTGADLMKGVREGLRVVNGNTGAWMRAVADHARGSDAILYAGLATMMAQTLAEALRRPAIGLWLQPTTTTREFPSPVLPPMRLPGWLNRLSYRLSPQAAVRFFYQRAAVTARKEIFGPVTRGIQPDENPMLYGFSKHLVQRPADWPAGHQICGHWPMPPGDWCPPQALLDFLAAGPPPIYLGLGAVASFVRQRGLTAIIAAIAGRRTVFFPGWSRIDASMLPENFFVVGNTPHPWLFPQTSLVIHHGGAGTSHTATRAGVPSIALPVGADQFFWAGRLAAVGVAPDYVRAGKITTAALVKMIEFTEREQVRERARELAAAMAQEEGVAVAVGAVARLMETAGRRSPPRGQGMSSV